MTPPVCASARSPSPPIAGDRRSGAPHRRPGYGSATRPCARATRGADVREPAALRSTDAGFATSRRRRSSGPRPAGSVRVLRARRRAGRVERQGHPARRRASRIKEAAAEDDHRGARRADGAGTRQARRASTRDGLAVAPADAPEAVKQVIEAGNEIADEALQVRRRPRQLEGLRLRLLGLGLIRAARRRPR